ncbi:MAG: tRNA pseudouridine(55) synthase TruB [Deferribacteraceae bacterium]|jgi:tRNA pseudouridine55 synthase|nr:tRNA pseudouridine(55) synthase TruB [Deferribacteraceae bacterium]
MDGIINVYKEAGMTSFDVVARIKRIFKANKCGHAGTLDPMAEGVLPVCIGYATRFADLLTAKDKQYIAQFRLGASYDTYDTTGTVRHTSDIEPTEDEVRKALSPMIGDIELTVPAFSAKKINGKRAYDLAREGKLEDAGKATMTITKIELMSYSYPDGVFVMDCGKGTYVRSVIETMGNTLGSYAAMSGLIRSQNGIFNVKNAHKIAAIEEAVNSNKVNDVLLAVEDVVDLPKAILYDAAVSKIANGIAPRRNEYKTIPEPAEDLHYLIMSVSGKLLALGEWDKNGGALKLLKVFAK